MPRINLLPWREELRKERQKTFYISIAAALVVGALVVGLANFVVGKQIDNQIARNKFLKDEIAELDKSIEKINGIERQKERLLARMDIIEQLQQSRPEVVHLFDELVRTLPDGTYYTDVTQTGRSIQLSGVAQSSTRVSSLMRNLDGGQWIGNPVLGKISSAGSARTAEQFTFVLKANQRVQNPENEEAE